MLAVQGYCNNEINWILVQVYSTGHHNSLKICVDWENCREGILFCWYLLIYIHNFKILTSIILDFIPLAINSKPSEGTFLLFLFVPHMISEGKKKEDTYKND